MIKFPIFAVYKHNSVSGRVWKVVSDRCYENIVGKPLKQYRNRVSFLKRQFKVRKITITEAEGYSIGFNIQNYSFFRQM